MKVFITVAILMSIAGCSSTDEHSIASKSNDNAGQVCVKEKQIGSNRFTKKCYTEEEYAKKLAYDEKQTQKFKLRMDTQSSASSNSGN